MSDLLTHGNGLDMLCPSLNTCLTILPKPLSQHHPIFQPSSPGPLWESGGGGSGLKCDLGLLAGREQNLHRKKSGKTKQKCLLSQTSTIKSMWLLPWPKLAWFTATNSLPTKMPTLASSPTHTEHTSYTEFLQKVFPTLEPGQPGTWLSNQSKIWIK